MVGSSTSSSIPSSTSSSSCTAAASSGVSGSKLTSSSALPVCWYRMDPRVDVILALSSSSSDSTSKLYTVSSQSGCGTGGIGDGGGGANCPFMEHKARNSYPRRDTGSLSASRPQNAAPAGCCTVSCQECETSDLS